MASTICGWCGDRTHTAMVTEPERLPGYMSYTYTATFQCSNEACHRLSIATVSRQTGYASPKKDMARETDLSWEPTHIPRREFPDVPEQIASAAVEAHACLAIRACRGAVALAR